MLFSEFVSPRNEKNSVHMENFTKFEHFHAGMKFRAGTKNRNETRAGMSFISPHSCERTTKLTGL